MAVNPYIVLDLMKPADTYTDLTPNFQGRVGDAQSIVKVWFKLNGLPYDLSDKEVAFLGIDPQGKRKVVTSTLDINTPGDSLRSGRVSFVFPAGVFAAPGWWDKDNTFFQIKKGGQVLSTINVQLHVLDNQVEFGITDKDIISDLDKLREDVHDKTQKILKELQQKTQDFNNQITADYDGIKNRLSSLQAQEDAIAAALKDKDVATKEYVAKYIAGDLLGTASVTANPDHLYPTGHVRVYTYGAGIPQTDTQMAGGSSVYEAQCRLVYVTPDLIQVYVSTEQLGDLMPGWKMATPPEVACGQDTAYLTSGVCNLAVQLEGVGKINSFSVDGKFQVGADSTSAPATSTTSN